jgi:hypothetical protein
MSWQLVSSYFGRSRLTLFNSILSLTLPPTFSSKWALSLVIAAWVGVIGSNIILFALAAPAFSQGTLDQLTLNAL